MKVSNFANKIAVHSGIGQLMDDLGFALSQKKDMLMLGGGAPAHIPQVTAGSSGASNVKTLP